MSGRRKEFFRKLCLCFKLHFKPLVFTYVKHALKSAEFQRANKNRICRKHRETWGVGGITYANGNVSVTTSRGEGKKISLWSAYLALHL